MDSGRIFAFLAERLAARQRCVLVTVCAVEGSSMRNPGTHMAVCEDGTYEGSLSGGCIENAVVAEAQAALKEGRRRIVRFGAGSPYLDIKLPCGGGLDIHFQPLSATHFVEQCQQAIAQRQPFSVAIGPEDIAFREGWHSQVLAADTATFGHWPRAKLQIIGHGASVSALATLALSMECDVSVLTPDHRVMSDLRDADCAVAELTTIDETELLESDPWTASMFLFHDHDWEIALMERALAMPHFYIGAMGGRRAHQMRSEALKQRGVSNEIIATIHAPIGLFHSSRDPQTLALSALGEVMQAYQTADFERANS